MEVAPLPQRLAKLGAKKRWGSWVKSWLYVNLGEGVPGVAQPPASAMVSHAFVAFPDFEVEETDLDEAAFRHTRVVSSVRDLVEEYIA